MIRKINTQTIQTRYRDFLRFSAFILPYWKIELMVIILNSLLIPLSLAMPYLTKLIIDKAYGNKDMGLFILLTLIGAVVFIINVIIGGVSSYLEGKIGIKVNFDLHSRLFQHLQRQSLKFFQDKSTGEHIYRMDCDVEKVASLTTETIPQFIFLTGRFLLILAMVFYLNWRMALLGVVLVPFLYLQHYYFIPKRRELLKNQIESSESIFVSLVEVFSHIHLIKAFGKEGWESRRFLECLLKRTGLFLRELRFSLYSGFIGNSLRNLILGALSLIGGYQIIRGKMTLGSLAAIMLYMSQLLTTSSSLSSFFEQLSINFIPVDRIKEILDMPPEIFDREDAVTINLSSADIELQDVTFGYQAGSQVLKNLSFSIKAGSAIALVGSSGCGKTTLLNLLLRLYDVREGKILFAGYDVRDVKLDNLKNQIGIALQEPYLWNDTFASNIRYAKPDASLEEIKSAAQVAQIAEFIESLPQGYDTNVGEMANKISEGQKQRVAIARAVAKNPAVLILDEAMSSLDSQTEERIITRLRDRFKSSILIVVSHRLSAVKKMDWVYFLERPDRMVIGRHVELIGKNQIYRELFARQT